MEFMHIYLLETQLIVAENFYCSVSDMFNQNLPFEYVKKTGSLNGVEFHTPKNVLHIFFERKTVYKPCGDSLLSVTKVYHE